MRSCTPTTSAPSATGRQLGNRRRPKRARMPVKIGAGTDTPTPVARGGSLHRSASKRPFLLDRARPVFFSARRKRKWGVHCPAIIIAAIPRQWDAPQTLRPGTPNLPRCIHYPEVIWDDIAARRFDRVPLRGGRDHPGVDRGRGLFPGGAAGGAGAALLVLPLRGEALAMEADVRELRRLRGAPARGQNRAGGLWANPGRPGAGGLSGGPGSGGWR